MAQPAQAYSSAGRTRSIADLIQRDGEIRAATTQRAGQIAGDTWSRVGDSVGSFLADLGRESRDAPERIRQQEAAKQRDAIAKENADAVKAERDRVNTAREKEGTIQAQVSLYRSKAMKQNEDGTWGLDLSNMRQQMEQAGLGERMDQIEQQYLGLQKDTQALANLKRQQQSLEDSELKKLGQMVIATGATREGFASAIAYMTKNGRLTDEQVAPFVARADKDPNAIGEIAGQLARFGDPQGAPGKPPAAGSLEDIIASRERELGRSLTADEKLKERTGFEKAGWKPERPPAGDKPDTLSLESRATIERDKENRLREAQKTADAALKEAEAEMGKARGGDQAKALAAFRVKKDAIYETLSREQAQIQRSYRTQMGEPGSAPARKEQPAPEQPSFYLPELMSPSASMGPRVSAAPPVGSVRPPAAPAAPAGPVTPKRVVTRAQLEAILKKTPGLTYEEAKRRAEQTFNLVVR